MQIQCPLALVDHNLRDTPVEREAATAFCNFLYTKAAQREFAACGFRCVEGFQAGGQQICS
jgi:sulfate transport system substrate-binding protein